jgi:CRISPR-associated protein Csb2
LGTLADDARRGLFDVLVAHLGYLGRSESWVIGESVADSVDLPNVGHAFPHSEGSQPGRGFQQIALSAPDFPDAYAHWRLGETEAAVSRLELVEGAKLTTAQRKKIDTIQGSYPTDIVDCLQRDTAWWKARRWSRAPGARSVIYWREDSALQVDPPLSSRVLATPSVEMMLLALTTPSGSKSALPAVVRTLSQAELLHRALVSKLGFHGEPCPELVGRDEAGEPLKGHQHSHLLPIDLDGDGRLDHIVVFAPMGLGARAQQAVRSVRKTYMKGGVGELQVAVAGAGALKDLRTITGELSRGVEALLGSKVGAASWVTTTPFVPPRYLKTSGPSSLIGQVEAELAVRGMPAAKVEVLDWAGERLPLRHFVRRRQRGPQPPLDVGFAVRISFDRPVPGPICLGYGSHFGLGRFRAVQEASRP